MTTDDTLRRQTRAALAAVAQRLARSVAHRLSVGAVRGADAPAAADVAATTEATRDPELAKALAFIDEFVRSAAAGVEASAKVALDALPDTHPLARIAHLHAPTGHASASPPPASLSPQPSPHELLPDLLLLACLPEAHEGLATLCRLLHPDGQPWPTVALALHWLESEAEAATQPCHTGDAAHEPSQARSRTAPSAFAVRDAVEAALIHGPHARLGLLRCVGDGPWHGRTLRPGPALWSALMGQAPQADDGRLMTGYAQVPGLASWLGQAEVQQAALALRRGLPCHVLVVGGDAAMRHTRVRALLGAAQATAILAPHDAMAAQAHDRHDPGDRPRRLHEAHATAWLHRAALWLEDRQDDAALAASDSTGGHAMPAAAQGLSGGLVGSLPVITSALNERRCPVLDLPQIRLPVQALAPVARRALWQSLLPQLGDQVPLLAARYPIEPDDARDVVRDLSLRQALHGDALGIDEVGACVRARTAWHARPGVTRLLPRAGWPALLLPRVSIEPLQAAVRRVLQQITVLDDWGFAQGRDDRRGVRMLFYGPPGTGKTLAAEVMAHALGVDLLVVDLSSLVSKYIGETEKNLAAVFEVAERSRALLLFDEADALFGKRTDAQDAHDRYANLETAYLLQRLERYEGVAVLTTNLRGQLDKAFSRRFEFIVEFPEPDASVREALWRLHLPAQAPLAPDVDLAELAHWYAISGAQIKNASLGAAFLAAAAGQRIYQRHFLWAVEQEFDKAGRAHPGFPPQHAGLSGATPIPQETS